MATRSQPGRPSTAGGCFEFSLSVYCVKCSQTGRSPACYGRPMLAAYTSFCQPFRFWPAALPLRILAPRASRRSVRFFQTSSAASDSSATQSI